MPLGIGGRIKSGFMERADSITFNAPGTFVAPNRLRSITANGKGGVGNPGNAGNGGTGGTGGTRGNGGTAGNPGRR